MSQKSYEVTGIWWFPNGETDVKFYGQLTYDSEKEIRLDLFGNSSDLPRDLCLHGDCTINGHGADGEEITLFYCHKMNNHENHFDMSAISFASEMIVLNACLPDLYSTNISSLIVRYTSLDDWLYEKLLVSSRHDDYEDAEEIVIRYEKDEPRKISIPSQDMKIELGFRPLTPWSVDYLGETYTVRQSARLEISFNNETNFGRHFEAMRTLRNLFAILVGKPVYTKEITGLRKGSKPLKYFYVSGRRYVDFDIPAELMLLPYRALNDWTKIFNNWYEKYERIKILVELVTSVIYRGHKVVDFEFLSLIQAIEGYHKCIRPDSKKSLKGRIEELHSDVQPMLRVHLHLKKKYIEKLVETRNYLSHRRKDPLKDILEESEVDEAVSFLGKLCLILIFEELGVGEPQIIKDAINRSEAFDYRKLWWR